MNKAALADFKNINAALYLPVHEGVWKQHELWDGTYTFDDWADIVELISIKNYNKSISLEDDESR